MTKKLLALIVSFPLVLVIAACSLIQPSTSTSTNQSQASNTAGQASQSVESKLAIGTLKLEGTDKAVTAAQAKTLLPLWKAVKSLSSSSTASNTEMTALYQQIQESMTAGQVQAIKDLNLSPDDTQSLMKQYNVQMPQGNFPTPNATQMAQRSSDGGGMAGGGPSDGGMAPGGPDGGMPPDGGGAPGGTGGNTNSAQPSAQGTPQAGQPRGGSGKGMNFIFVDPLIQVLEQRAGA
jgi:hypothetical protein